MVRRRKFSPGVVVLAVLALASTAACGSTAARDRQLASGGSGSDSSGLGSGSSSAGGSPDGLGSAGGGGTTAGGGSTGTAPGTSGTLGGGGSAVVPGGGGSTGSGATGTGSGATGTGSGATGTGTGATGTGSGATGTTRGTGGGATTGTKPDASGVLQGPGITPTTVTIGVGYVSNGDAANAAVGAGGLASGDPVGEAKAVLADINSHGGVGHRTLKALFHPTDAQSTSTSSSQDESACADYTQDHQVFAVADLGLTETLPTCLAKAGVLQTFSGDIISHDRAFYQRYPHFSDLGTLTQERMMTDLSAALVRERYFDGWNTTTGGPAAGPAKIGILTFDQPDFSAPLSSVLLPALAQAGHPVNSADVFKAHFAATTSEAGQTATDAQSAALRFRQDGVTHVIVLDGSGLLTIFFGQNAKNQHYFPRFGVNSGTGMQALVDAKAVDAAQFNGALGVGWLPGVDLSEAAGRKYASPAAAHCLSVMTQAGFSFKGANDRGIAYGICDELYLIASVINRAGQSITLTNAQAALDQLGSSFVPAQLPAAFLSSSQHDAVTTDFALAWDSGCNCANYTDAGHRVG